MYSQKTVLFIRKHETKEVFFFHLKKWNWKLFFLHLSVVNYTENVLSVEFADFCLPSKSKNKHLLFLHSCVCDWSQTFESNFNFINFRNSYYSDHISDILFLYDLKQHIISKIIVEFIKCIIDFCSDCSLRFWYFIFTLSKFLKSRNFIYCCLTFRTSGSTQNYNWWEIIHVRNW